MKKVAIVLFNLGGPDQPSSIQPFLFNLFRDPAIIGLPNPFRWALAKLISTTRAPKAKPLYDLMGGKSPLLDGTMAQAQALETLLNESSVEKKEVFKVFIAMRYWHPFTSEAVSEIKVWGADEVVLLPLYPQYSTTTTASSFREWDRCARQGGLSLPTLRISEYPTNSGLIQAFCEYAVPLIEEANTHGSSRLLFSAHGIPQNLVDKGDPYQKHVEETAAALLAALPVKPNEALVCYQSKVGPLKWLQPSTEDEVNRAADEGKAIILVPLAFVSEHIETLVELDVEYREIADHKKAPYYGRVPTPSVHPAFIAGLAAEIKTARPHT